MYKSFFKRVLDVIISFSALIILSPLFILVIIALFVANEGAGVFFFQERPGVHERIFRILKFKTMTDKEDENGKLLPDAKRLTKVGRFIRSCSIDELPQLINVLKGDMSLIGPRPLAVVYLPYYSEQERHRHDVRPGITGWAQVNGRKALTWEERFYFDLQYVNTLTFGLDLKIFFLTIQKIIKKDNVNVDSQGAESFHSWRKKQLNQF